MKLLLTATIATLMFGLGLGLRASAVASLRHRPALAARVVLGSCLLVPLAALLLLSLPPAATVPRGVRLAILAMAICPSAPLGLRRAGRHGGDRELAAGLQLLGAAVAVLTIPLLVQLLQLADYGVLVELLEVADRWHEQLVDQVALLVVEVDVAVGVGSWLLLRRGLIVFGKEVNFFFNFNKPNRLVSYL